MFIALMWAGYCSLHSFLISIRFTDLMTRLLKNYDSLSFFGIRQALNFGKIEKKNPSEEVKKNGLLGIIRHPMYLALIIILWCQIFTMSDIVVNTILTIYIIIATRLEEKKLALEFGDTYVKYQQEVPMFIPFSKNKVK
ncbi:MAG: isoprenylcysteine carboxylmethyltransferase family protein [Methanothrix sp.]|nr:isoprenylcysteine carboxylmethyltransferase family protein [Methanothrix sp.]